MRNLRIGTKLTVSFGAVVLFLVGVAVFAILSLSNMNALTNKIVDDRVPKMNMASEISAAIFALRNSEAEHILSRDPAAMTAAEAAITARKAVIEKDYATLDPKVKKPRTRKALDEFKDQPPMDLVVTVCDDAAEECPYFPGARRQEHWAFPDPSAVTGSEEEQLAAFRSVRDAIVRRIETFVRQPAN